MSGFSIDLAADRIVDHRTRIYFQEVARSFANECYRSSLVLLWTVVVCDLVYKLQSLRDIYGDTLAGTLLKDVEAKRLNNPNSPDWELFLLDELAKRTKMLETAEHAQLQNLQKLRHLSAHPVLTAADLLFHPSKDMARAQIRMAMEAVLLKPALFSKRIIDALLEDIASNKAILISRDKLKSYIEARYLPNMPPAIELELFRTLWKFCFKLKNADTDQNRKINVEALAIIYIRNTSAIRKMIHDDKAYFSNVGPENELLDVLIDFLANYSDLYQTLDHAAQILIEGRVSSEINNRAKAVFVHTDMGAHLAALAGESGQRLGEIEEGVWHRLVTEAERDGQLEAALTIAAKAYGGSNNYNDADARFSRFISPALSKFTASNMVALLTAIESNQQVYGRWRAKLDHHQVLQSAIALQVDTSAYPNLRRSL